MQIVFNAILRASVAEPEKDRPPINDVGIACSDDFPVPTVDVVTRIFDCAGRNRVEVDVRDNLAEVLIRIDDPRSVPTLPEPSEIAVSPVVSMGATFCIVALHG